MAMGVVVHVLQHGPRRYKDLVVQVCHVERPGVLMVATATY